MKPFLLSLFLMVSFLFGWSQSRATRASELYEQAQREYRNRSFESADKSIEKSLAILSTAEAYYLSGLINEALKRDLRAVAAFEATLKLNPDFREAIFQKALIYLRYGDPSQALKDFNQLLESGAVSETRGLYFQIDPRGDQQVQVTTMASGSIESQLYHYRGQSHEKLGDYDLAMEDYNHAIHMTPHPDYYISRGLLYSKSDRESLAIGDLKTAIRLDPQNQLAWYNLTLLDHSVKLPDHLIGDSDFAPILSLLASRAMETRNYGEAKRYFDQCLANDPQDALAYINRGRVLMKMEQYDEARSDFNKAKRIEPTRTEILYLLGNTYFFERNYETAVAYYDQYLIVDPGNAMVWYNAAMSYLEQGQEEDACHYLSRAQTLGMTQARSLLGRFCQ